MINLFVGRGMIIPVITYNKDQIQGVLEELCRGFALRY
jgi:hypothetical protein